MLIKFETAKLAKEQGFGKTLELIFPHSYRIVTLTSYVLELNSSNNTQEINICAPKQSELQKWLREICNIHIKIHAYTDSSFGFELYFMVSSKFKYLNKHVHSKKSYNSFEKSLEEALVEGLKLKKRYE